MASSQKATIAVEILPWYEAEAKKRMATHQEGDVYGSEKIHGGKATEQVAQALGTNAHYVSDAKKLKEENPELYKEVRDGTKTLSDATKEVRLGENMWS